MISQEDRARITDLALRALDEIDETYDGDVNLEDAVLIFDVSYERDGETFTELSAKTTTHRSAVAGGIAQAYANVQLNEYVDSREIEDED